MLKLQFHGPLAELVCRALIYMFYSQPPTVMASEVFVTQTSLSLNKDPTVLNESQNQGPKKWFDFSIAELQ